MDGNAESRLVNRDDCVLVVIDVQEKLVPAISEKEKITENIVRLVRFAKVIDFPLIVCEQIKLGSTIPPITDALEVCEPIIKSSFSCFGCDEFVSALKALNRKTLILVGIEAHVCVTQTALDACSAGFTVHAVCDAISSRDIKNAEVAFHRMSQNGVVLNSTEMLIYEIMKKAGTSEFKQVLPLVK